MKTNKLVAIVSLLMLVVFAACEKDDFEETNGVCPLVVETNPEDGDTNVPLNQVITATFNTEMNPETLTSGAITIHGSSEITGTISYDQSTQTASFTPTELLTNNTTYAGSVKTSVKDIDGNALQEAYLWTFSTGNSISPIVIATDPENNATSVAVNTAITATFNQPMDALTLDETTFLVTQEGTSLDGAITYSGTTASFTPTADLDINATYTATVTTGTENTSGIALQDDYSWTFTTGVALAPTVTSTDPEHEETTVALDKIIEANFSEEMDAATINGTTFILQEGTNLITGVVSYTGTTASFDPAAALEQNTLYTATITTEAATIAGISLTADHTWEFTTGTTSGGNLIDLGAAEPFGILSGVGISNDAGPSEIHNLDVGIYPGVRSSITGFMDVDGGPGLLFNGDFYAADDAAPIPAMLLDAKNDLTAAYLEAEGATAPAPTTIAGDIGGQTLAPGIYKSTSTLLIQNGNLTLDAQGDPNASWIFQVASDFTTVGGAPYPSPAGGNIILSGGAQAGNIIWQVGSSAIIGDYTSFKGNILALTSVTMNAFAQTEGRMLCANGSVVLTSTNFIYNP